MKIININSEIQITPAQESFIENVLCCGDDNYSRNIDHHHPAHHHPHHPHHPNHLGHPHRHYLGRASFYGLSQQIPIFLINETVMERNGIDSESEHDKEEAPSTEWLGFYQRRDDDIFDNTPIIAICPDRIASIVKSEEEFMFLCAKVIVHEFAHAKMDFLNQSYGQRDEFYRWMEESAANYMVLEVFQSYWRHSRAHGYLHTHSYRGKTSVPFRVASLEETLFDFVKGFIKKQPPEYALGYELHQKDMYECRDWGFKNSKTDLGGDNKNKEKSDWLLYMKNNYKSIDRETSRKLYKALFNKSI